MFNVLWRGVVRGGSKYGRVMVCGGLWSGEERGKWSRGVWEAIVCGGSWCVGDHGM